MDMGGGENDLHRLVELLTPLEVLSNLYEMTVTSSNGTMSTEWVVGGPSDSIRLR